MLAESSSYTLFGCQLDPTDKLERYVNLSSNISFEV